MSQPANQTIREEGKYSFKGTQVHVMSNTLTHSVTIQISGKELLGRSIKLKRLIAAQIGEAGLLHTAQQQGTPHPTYVASGDNNAQCTAAHEMMAKVITEFLEGFQTAATAENFDKACDHYGELLLPKPAKTSGATKSGASGRSGGGSGKR